jgi:hypothetical protein
MPLGTLTEKSYGTGKYAWGVNLAIWLDMIIQLMNSPRSLTYFYPIFQK